MAVDNWNGAAFTAEGAIVEPVNVIVSHKIFRQRLTLPASGVAAAPNWVRPANSRILSIQSRLVSALPVGGAASTNGTANALAFVTPTGTTLGTGAIANLATGTATTRVLGITPTTTASNTVYSVFSESFASGAGNNAATTQGAFLVIPYASGGTNVIVYNTTTPTNGYTFGTNGGTVDIQIVYEELTAIPQL